LHKQVYYINSDSAVSDDGAFTGTKFHETVNEVPGISPAIAGIALTYCTFSSLQDVGLPLPPYSEEIVRIPMTAKMKTQYRQADGSETKSGLFRWAINRMKDKDGKGSISVWLNTALNRPDTMFRAEGVTFTHRVGKGKGKFARRETESVKLLEKVTDDWLPKEIWAADTALAEQLAGRKTLIYVRQTGERDIQGRLKQCFEARGLRVGILKPSLAPHKRATWIKNHVAQFDVLLTNAKLVEVGLNLTMFSTAIFFEMEWSLYVLWQAMRRLYRPGAPKPVKVYFPVYSDTLEERALDLLGTKMMAAQVFYGDEVSGALSDEADDGGNLLNDLVRQAMGKLDVGRAEGVFGVTNTPAATESPLGSPTAVSPQLPTTPQIATLAMMAYARREANRKRKATPNENQLNLFG
jgi:hypothetical protein